MEQAAANLGASRWTIFRRITLPLMRPGLFAGGTIVLIWSFTELGTPLMFDYYHVTPGADFQSPQSGAGQPAAVRAGRRHAGHQRAAVRRRQARPRPPTGRGDYQGVRPVERAKLSFLQSIPVLVRVPSALAGSRLLPHVGVILYSVSGIGAWYQSAIPKVFTAQHYLHGLSHELAMPSVLQ